MGQESLHAMVWSRRSWDLVHGTTSTSSALDACGGLRRLRRACRMRQLWVPAGLNKITLNGCAQFAQAKVANCGDGISTGSFLTGLAQRLRDPVSTSSIGTSKFRFGKDRRRLKAGRSSERQQQQHRLGASATGIRRATPPRARLIIGAIPRPPWARTLSV